jgi:hypothetical protein
LINGRCRRMIKQNRKISFIKVNFIVKYSGLGVIMIRKKSE